MNRSTINFTAVISNPIGPSDLIKAGPNDFNPAPITLIGLEDDLYVLRSFAAAGPVVLPVILAKPSSLNFSAVRDLPFFNASFPSRFILLVVSLITILLNAASLAALDAA